MRISFIGIGLMGNPIAERLIDHGYELYIYNRTMNKTNYLKEKGAKVALTANEAINLSNIIILMLTDGAAVNEVLFSNEHDYTNKTIIQMSTILPDESEQICDRIKVLNGSYIEAPVLGSIPQAQEGKLFILAAGNREIFNDNSELLSKLGQVHYLGEIRKGSTVKLALNQLIAALSVSFSFSLGIIQREGIDPELFMDVLRKSPIYAATYDIKLKNYLVRDFSKANFPVKHLLKDIKLVKTEAKSLGLNTKSIESIEKILEETIKNGHGEEDYSALFTTIVPAP